MSVHTAEHATALLWALLLPESHVETCRCVGFMMPSKDPRSAITATCRLIPYRNFRVPDFMVADYQKKEHGMRLQVELTISTAAHIFT